MITAENIYKRAKVLSSDSDEVCQRECIKTAYYSVLHRIQEICDKQNIDNIRHQNMGSHESMIERINQQNKPSEKIIVNYAKKMKKKRRDADYKLTEHITDKDVSMQMHYAEKCWELLNIDIPSE